MRSRIHTALAAALLFTLSQASTLATARAAAPLESPPPTREEPDEGLHDAAPEGAPIDPADLEDFEDEELFEAVAEVERPAQETTRRVLEQEQLTHVAGTSGDALLAVQTLPGVARSDDGPPILRGSAPSESVVLLDGSSLPLLYHFGGLRSVVHPRLLDSIELYPGNFSAAYGRATGGAVVAHLRAPHTDGWGGEVDVNLIDTSVLVTGPLHDEVQLAAAVRRSNIDLVLNAMEEDGNVRTVAAPVYWDYQGLVEYAPDANTQLRLAAFGSRDDLKLLFEEPEQTDPTLRGGLAGNLEFHRVQLTQQQLWGGVKQKLQATWGHQLLQQAAGDAVRARFSTQELESRASWQFPLGESTELIAGWDVMAQWFTGEYRGQQAPPSEGALDVPQTTDSLVVVEPQTYRFISPAAYLELRTHLADSLLLLPSLRMDYYSLLDEFTFDPRLAQRYRLSDAVTLKSGVGWFSQPPIYYEALPDIGNPNIDPYSALHVSAGVELRGERSQLDVEGFYKRIQNNVVGTEGGAPPRFENAGRGRVVGMEVGMRHSTAGGSDLALAYTLSRSERQERDQAYRLFDSDQTHVLNLTASTRLPWGLRLGARFRYITGNPSTNVEGSAFDAGAGLYQPLYGSLNASRDPAFHQLDVRLDKRFRIGSGALTAYLDVQNVYSADNPQGFTYSYDYTEREPATSIPFFPNLGLRGEL